MKWNVEIDINIHEILCWVALIFLAWNPYGMFGGFLNEVGYKIPILLLASGAGSNHARQILKGGKQ